MLELSFRQVMKHMGTALLLDNINFSVYENDKVGVVGANGTGKSTVLKLIAGIEPLNRYPGSWSPGYDYGWIKRTPGSTVAYLDQIPEYDRDITVLDVLNTAFEEVFELEKQMRALEVQMGTAEGASLDKLLKEYGRITDLFELKGGYEVKEKLSKVCTGLQLDESFLQTPFHLLSGGEKTTAVLGKLLIDQPDILLLDEPTNHLDTDAVEWLEEYLQGYKGIVMVVSHDRYFLDKVTNKTIELEDLGAKVYDGNYSSFVKQKNEALRVQQMHYEEQKKEVQAMERKVRQLREWALKADNNKFFQRAASIQNKLDRMKRVEKPKFERPNMRLDLTVNQRSGREAVIATNLIKRYDGRTLIDHANLLVHYGERIALVGPNGCGKSTVLKMLLGDIKPDDGHIQLGASTRVAYLPQKITFDNEECSVLECFRDQIIIEEGKGREYLAKYMFYGKRVFTPVKGLSGGERIRLKLAILLYEDVNLLVLDEPTNHLDIASIETLEQALEDFKGTLLYVSHDRYFIDKISDRIVAIEDRTFTVYEGKYDMYRQAIKDKRAQVQNAENKEVQSAPSQKHNRDKSVPSNMKKQEEKRISAEEVEKLEKRIEALEAELVAVEKDMLICGHDLGKLRDLHEKHLGLQEELKQKWQVWEAAHVHC